MLIVYLYGHLGNTYGKKHRLNVASPAEAIRAFSANYKDFRQKLIDGGGYRVLAGNEERDIDGITLPTSKAIKIIPAVAGKGGFGKIIAGAALIGASFYLPGAGALGSGLFSSLSLSSMASSIGFSLLLGGVSQMLFSPPKPHSSGASERPENRPSYNFNGAVNTTGQGGAVPLAYGKVGVGSQLISAGTETVNL